MTAALRGFLISTFSLGSFFWGLYRMPMPAEGGAALDEEQSRQLREDVVVATRLGKWPRALKAALKLHEAYPGEPIYLANLGQIYGHLGRDRESAEAWSEYLDHSPTPIEGCPQAAQAYERQAAAADLASERARLTGQAIRVFERCLSFEPDNPDSVFYLAHALERSGQIERAEGLYRRGMEVSPDYSDMVVGMARIRLRQGRTEESRRLAAEVLSRQPQNVDALLVSGLASRRLGDRASAKDYLLRGVRLAPKDGDFCISLAEMAEDEGDVRSAIQFYEKAVAADRGNTELAHKLAALRRVGE